MQIHYLLEENSVLNHFLGRQIWNVTAHNDSMRFEEILNVLWNNGIPIQIKNLEYTNIEIVTTWE
jgi:uracil phosphoribosyltransferase